MSQDDHTAGLPHVCAVDVQAADLPEPMLTAALALATALALESGRVTTLVGIVDGQFMTCDTDCCRDRRGALVLVPDTLVLEGVADGLVLLPDNGLPVEALEAIGETVALTLERDDGRSVLLFSSRTWSHAGGQSGGAT